MVLTENYQKLHCENCLMVQWLGKETREGGGKGVEVGI